MNDASDKAFLEWWDKDGNAYWTTCDGSAPNEPEVKAQDETQSLLDAWEIVHAWMLKDTGAYKSVTEVAQQQLARRIAAALSGANVDCGEFDDFWKDFNSKYDKEVSNDPECSMSDKDIAHIAFLAGQKSKAATLKLPELEKTARFIWQASRKQTLRDVLEVLPAKRDYLYSEIDNAEPLENTVWNECLDAVKSRIEKAMGE